MSGQTTDTKPVTYSAWIIQGGPAGGAYYIRKNPLPDAMFEVWLCCEFGKPVIEDAESEYAAAYFCAKRYGCYIPMTIHGAPSDE